MDDRLEKIMEEVEINVDGLTDEIISYELTPDQYKWFLLEVGKVQELECKLSINTNNMKQLQQENQCYKEALEFYADKGNYDIYYDEVGIIGEDGGKKARQALKGNNHE